MRNILLFNVIFCFLCFGCNKDDIEIAENQEQKNKFMKQTVTGVYNGGSALLMYQEDVHQIAYSSDKKNWRIQNDDLSVYISCVLSEAATTDKEITATIKTKGVEGISDSNQTVTVLKIENKKCWVWCGESCIGILTEME